MLLGRLLAAQGDQVAEKRSCSCWGPFFAGLLLGAIIQGALTFLARCKMENECLWCEEEEECEERHEHEEEKE